MFLILEGEPQPPINTPRTCPKHEPKAIGSELSTTVRRPSITVANKSTPKSRSTGVEIWKSGSANAKLKYLFFIHWNKERRFKWAVMVDNTHVSNASTGSGTKCGSTRQSTRPCTSTIGTPDNPVIGAVHRDQRRPKCLAHVVVIALVWDPKSIKARTIW